jgi:hypothetical protein
VTLAGTVAGTVPVPPLENAFDSVTTAPPDGAPLDSVTVPVADAPPTTEVGLIVNALIVVGPPGVISNSADCPGLPARSAKMFMLNCEVTGEVVIVNEALVAPAGTVMLDGICATVVGAGVESAITVAPLCGALNVTVPIAELPPTTLDGLTETPESTGGGGLAETVSTRLN